MNFNIRSLKKNTTNYKITNTGQVYSGLHEINVGHRYKHQFETELLKHGQLSEYNYDNYENLRGEITSYVADFKHFESNENIYILRRKNGSLICIGISGIELT